MSNILPDLTSTKIFKNKIINKKINLLGDYVFCYHESFSNLNSFNEIKFLKGVTLLLEGYFKEQDEINKFIKNLKAWKIKMVISLRQYLK